MRLGGVAVIDNGNRLSEGSAPLSVQKNSIGWTDFSENLHTHKRNEREPLLVRMKPSAATRFAPTKYGGSVNAKFVTIGYG